MSTSHLGDTNSMNMGIYSDCPTNNMEGNAKSIEDKNHEGFTKVWAKGKGGKRPHKKSSEDINT